MKPAHQRHFHPKTVLLSSILTFSVAVPSIAQPRPTIIPATSSNVSLGQKLQKWGFVPVACNDNVVRVQSQSETVCVQPTSELPLGNYNYDSVSNQIQPINNATNLPLTSSSSESSRLTPDSVSAHNVFKFTNLYDYSSCLDDILLVYEGRLRRENGQITLIYPEMSRIHEKKSNCIDKVIDIYGNRLNNQQTYELLNLANFRATQLLDARLYPPRGIRRRAAQLVGFIYEIDRTNAEILQLVPSN
ncbi:MAG: hypothetical protein AB4058_10935 [Microcystaceae cyanobacterium]